MFPGPRRPQIPCSGRVRREYARHRNRVLQTAQQHAIAPDAPAQFAATPLSPNAGTYFPDFSLTSSGLVLPREMAFAMSVTETMLSVFLMLSKFLPA